MVFKKYFLKILLIKLCALVKKRSSAKIKIMKFGIYVKYFKDSMKRLKVTFPLIDLEG
jgi:hypothetical protein